MYVVISIKVELFFWL